MPITEFQMKDGEKIVLKTMPFFRSGPHMVHGIATHDSSLGYKGNRIYINYDQIKSASEKTS
jgi:hypothetical protein